MNRRPVDKVLKEKLAEVFMAQNTDGSFCLAENLIRQVSLVDRNVVEKED